jgi:hypothetical protein
MHVKILIILLVIMVGAVAASAQSVKVTSDASVDLARYKTYAWAQPLPMGNPAILRTLFDAIDQAMAAKGLKLVDAEPELTITFWTATESDLHIVHGTVASHTAPSLASAASQSWPVTQGTLVVVFTDAATKNGVWRATASQTLEYGPSGNLATDAKTVEKPIRKAVAKMFKKFPRPK